MKKYITKIMAIVLSVGIIFSLAVASSIGASAATVNNPVIEVRVVGETSTQLIVDVNVVSGEFNCIDFGFETTSLLKCTAISKGSGYKAFDTYCEGLEGSPYPSIASNSSTGLVAMASTEVYTQTGSIVRATFKKTADRYVVASDITINVTNCTIFEDSSVKYTELTPSVSTVVYGVSLDSDSLNMNYKSTAKLTATVNPQGSSTSFTWSSSDNSVVSVDDKGNLTALKRGSAIITVTTNAGKTATCNVKVGFAWWQWVIYIVLFGFLWY